MPTPYQRRYLSFIAWHCLSALIKFLTDAKSNEQISSSHGGNHGTSAASDVAPELVRVCWHAARCTLYGCPVPKRDEV